MPFDRARRLGGAGRGRRARAALGIEIARSFGSTEHPSITGSTPDAPRDKRVNTDGRPLPGVEIRLVDDDGNDVGVGRAGRDLEPRSRLLRRLHRRGRDAAAFSADGWFMTGDIGVLDDRRLPRDHRPQEGHHHPRRRERERRRRSRSCSCACPTSPRSRWSPRPTRGSASRVRVLPHAGRARRAAARRGARPSRTGRPRPAEVAGDIRAVDGVPAHAERQGAEVRAAPTVARRRS